MPYFNQESLARDTPNETEITDLCPKTTSDLFMEMPQNIKSIQLAENDDFKVSKIISVATATEIAVNQNIILPEFNNIQDKMLSEKNTLLKVTGFPLSPAATNSKLSLNQDTSTSFSESPITSESTANELTMNQVTELPGLQDLTAATNSKLSVNQDTSTSFSESPITSESTANELPMNQVTELPGPQDLTITEFPVKKIANNLPENTAVSNLPVLNNSPATEMLVIQSSTDTELTMNQNVAVSELSVTNDTTPKVIESQDSIVSEMPVNQDTSATDINNEVAQFTSNTIEATSSDNILQLQHLGGQQCLVDKANSCEESILTEDDRSFDDFHIKEPMGTESDVSNGSQKGTVCELCGLTTAIYTCPGCFVKTCSVSCVKEHKRRFYCNGERNKTAFVDISEYSENHLLNDYRFLEDANRQIYSNKAGAGFKRKNNFGDPNHLTKRCKLLVNAAYKRGVKVQMVAQVLSKHKLNTSYYTIRLDLLSWHVEWLFVASNTVVRDEKVPENTILIEAARKWTNAVNHPELRKPLEDYKKEHLDKSRFLLKIDCLPANRQRYFEMKPNMSIAENLKGHCLTEFPIIAVLPPSYPRSDEFILFSSADLLFMDPANRRHVMTNLQGMDFQTELIAQLVDPKSHIYSAKPDVIDIDSKE